MKTESVEIIAEIGFNHEGNLDLALDMIDAAAEAGARTVKFQTFRAGDILLPASPFYQVLLAGEMSLDQHRALAEAADRAGVEFMSTPFSRWAVDLLEEVGVKRYKIASMDLTNFDLLQYVAETGKPLVVSTGMATLAEVGATVDFLLARGAADVTLLHCVANYPCAEEDLGLATIGKLKDIFGLPVGYSDHYPGIKACLAAAILGAEVIETHFTLDNSLPGADHAHSADPSQLKSLIEDIKRFQKMTGDRDFMAGRPDRVHAPEYRRGLYAARDLEAGAEYGREAYLKCRPESELSPNDLFRLADRPLRRPVSAHAPLSWKDY